MFKQFLPIQFVKWFDASGLPEAVRPNPLLLLLLFAASLAFAPNAAAQTPHFSKDVGSSSNAYPFNTNSSKRFQQFYAPGDLGNATSGNITRVYFKAHAIGTGTFADFKVKLGQSTTTSYPGDEAKDFFTGLTTVMASPSFTLTANAANEWVAIDLQTPFLFDAGRTLIIELEMSAKTSTGGFAVKTSTGPSSPNHRRLVSSSLTATTGTTSSIWSDFGIDVAATPACTTPPTAGNVVSSVPYICANTTFQLNLNGATVGSDITYQWQSSADGATNWTNIANANTSSLITSQANTTYYRVLVTCSGVSVPSGSVQVLTNNAGIAGVYTINKNVPFSATNYISVASAVQDLICRGVVAPVTFNVVAGTGPYDEQVVIPAINGVSAANTITFNGNGNTISFTASSSNRSIFRLDGADFITINDFTIETIGTSYGWGVHLLNGADNNIISNNNILINSTSATESTSGGIVFSNSNTSVTTAGNTGNNNLISGNTITGGYTGITLNSVITETGNNQLKNNTIKNSYSNGIIVNAAKGTLVEGNDISRPGSSSTATTFTGIEISGQSLQTTISKNRIHNTHDALTTKTGGVYGIFFTSNDAPAGSENVVKNNLIYNLTNTGTVYALYNSGSDGVYFYHNTVNLDGANTGAVRGFFQTTLASNIRFINNLVSISGTGTGVRHAIYLGTNTSGVTSNNNAFYIDPTLTAANVGYFLVNQVTLEDWKTANANAYDQNSLFADPLYANAASGDFKPTNSVLNDIGQALAAVTDDITGATRSNNPDPGAYEFAPIGNDAGTEAFISPATPALPGVSHPVQVTIKNYGVSNITSLVINWSVNGTAQTPFNWTGSLAGGQVSAPVTIGNFTFPTGAFALEVCTANPNGGADSNAANNCLTNTVYACSPLSGNFTIDQNAPASATNFQSIAIAAQALNNCGINGPVNFSVVSASGPYNEKVEFASVPGASATNTITFNGNGNTLSFKSTGAARAVVTLNETDHVTFTNFTISATDSTYGWGIHLLNGADNNVISNNTVNLVSTSTTEANSVGIVFSNANSSVAIVGNTGNNNIISGNTITGGYKGIHVNGVITGTGNNKLLNNTIKDFYADGITVNAAKGTLVEGNDISRPTRAAVTTFTGIEVMGGSQETVISKNRLHNTHDAAASLTSDVYGIYIIASDAPVGQENIVNNNAIYNVNNQDVIYGIYNSGSDGAHFFHNTVDINTTSGGNVRGFYQSVAATNIKFINNIVKVEVGASGKAYAVYFNTKASAIASNNNVLYIPFGNIGYYNDTTYTTLADWKAGNNNVYDQQSVSANPTFVNAATGNLQPNVVGVDNVGQPLATVTDDITGAPRSTTAPDAGAFEFSVAANDLGITQILGPTGTCGFNGQDAVSVTVKNFGSTVQTNIQLSLSVNGTVITTAPEVFVFSLAPNATATYTFTTKANLAASGSYVIEARTTLNSDSDPTNDAATLTVLNSLVNASLPLSINFETPATGLAALTTAKGSKANLTEDAAASVGTGSTKGLVLEGATNPNWDLAAALTSPWTGNPDNFAGAYLCFSPTGGTSTDPMWLSFDLKQLYKNASANTNFRVTVNGTPVGGNQVSPANTYRPPFNGVGGTTNWTKVYIDLSAYKNEASIQIGFESSVSEGFANGTGTANLVDNIRILRVDPTGTAKVILASQLNVYPNPSTGIFSVALPQGKAFEMEVMDLTGRTILKQKASANAAMLDLSKAAKGVYLLKVSAEGTSTVKRVVVE